MYEDFFEMKKTPFVRSIPVDDLYMDQDTEEIHNRLLYATRRQLFALVIGDPGTGKTTSLRRLKSALNGQEYAVLYLSESKLTPRYFYNGLLEQLGCETRFYRGDARNLLHHQIEIMRGAQELGISSIRGGGIVGEHDVLFCGPDEVVTLSHSAGSRGVFADGAVQAALYIAALAPGYYTMTDLLRGKLICE